MDPYRLVRPLVMDDLRHMWGQTHHSEVKQFIRHAIRAVKADDMKQLKKALLGMDGWNFYRRAPTVFFQLRTGIDLNLTPNPRAVYGGNGVTLRLDEVGSEALVIRRRLDMYHVQWPVQAGEKEEEWYCEYLRRSLSGLLEREVAQTSSEGQFINQMIRLRLSGAITLLRNVRYRRFDQVEILLRDVSQMGLNVDVEHVLVYTMLQEHLAG